MKRTISIFVLMVVTITVLVTVSLTFWQQNAADTSISTKLAGSEEISAPVRNFWSASLQSEKVKLDEQLMDTPKSFLAICNEKDTTSVLRPGSSLPVGEAKGLSSNFIEQNRSMLLAISEKIGKEKYQLFDIVKIKQEGQEAVVEVRYGTPDFPYKVMSFLLYKENDNWKIFMTASLRELTNYNKQDFAEKSQCSK